MTTPPASSVPVVRLAADVLQRRVALLAGGVIIYDLSMAKTEK